MYLTICLRGTAVVASGPTHDSAATLDLMQKYLKWAQHGHISWRRAHNTSYVGSFRFSSTN